MGYFIGIDRLYQKYLKQINLSTSGDLCKIFDVAFVLIYLLFQLNAFVEVTKY